MSPARNRATSKHDPQGDSVGLPEADKQHKEEEAEMLLHRDPTRRIDFPPT